MNLFFHVKCLYAISLGEWSLQNYSDFSRDFYGFWRYFTDLPGRFSFPFLIWLGFNWDLVISIASVHLSRRESNRADKQQENPEEKDRLSVNRCCDDAGSVVGDLVVLDLRNQRATREVQGPRGLALIPFDPAENPIDDESFDPRDHRLEVIGVHQRSVDASVSSDGFPWPDPTPGEEPPLGPSHRRESPTPGAAAHRATRSSDLRKCIRAPSSGSPARCL